MNPVSSRRDVPPGRLRKGDVFSQMIRELLQNWTLNFHIRVTIHLVLKTNPLCSDVGSAIEGLRQRSGLHQSPSYPRCLSICLGVLLSPSLISISTTMQPMATKEFFPALNGSDLVEDKTIKMFRLSICFVISNCDQNLK